MCPLNYQSDGVTKTGTIQARADGAILFKGLNDGSLDVGEDISVPVFSISWYIA